MAGVLTNALQLYRLGQEDRVAEIQLARKQAEMQERKSAIQAYIDAKMTPKPGGLASYATPKTDAPAPMGPDQAGPILNQATQTGSLGLEPAAGMSSALPTKGEAAMEGYLADKGIAVNPSVSEPPAKPDDGKIRLMAIDPELAMQLEDHFAKEDKAQREAWGAKMKVMGAAAIEMQRYPLAQRALAFRQVVAPALLAQGWTATELNQADLSDRGLGLYQAMAMDADKIISEARQRASDAETARHNKTEESLSDRRARTAEGALNLAKEREGRLAKGGVTAGDLTSSTTDALLSAAGIH